MTITTHKFAPRLLAGFGTLTLLAGLGLASSRPAHTAGGPIAVNVANTPLPTSDVALAGRTPFSVRLNLTVANGYSKETITVPAGKRLVLTYASGSVYVAVGAHVLTNLGTVNGGAEVEASLPAVSQGVLLGQEAYTFSAPMTVYADPGSTVTFDFLDSDTTGEGGANVGLYGYLENA